MKTPANLAAVAALAALSSCASAPAPMEAPASLAAAETAFAAHSVRENMRPAFLAAFADDGVTVRQGGWITSNTFLATRPDPPIVLDWKPVYVEVARSGELGLSTGPSKVTSAAKPNDPPAYGQFVSIWRRQGQGPWKVEVDLGIQHPGPALWDQPLEATVAKDSRGTMQNARTLRLAEEQFSRASARDGARAAYSELGSERLRFYRGGAAPALGKAAALQAPGMTQDKLAWTAERVESAFSGDFGYVRGRYALAEAPEKVLGHYLRVWRLEANDWRVALDVTNPAAQ
jgi:ketosteroid isomerase-like protein